MFELLLFFKEEEKEEKVFDVWMFPFVPYAFEFEVGELILLEQRISSSLNLS